MNPYKDTLIQSGLTENEAVIYSTLLDVGPKTASEITTLCQLNRSSTYYVLDKLVEDGLLRKNKSGTKTYFEVTHPRHLNSILQRKQAELEEAQTTLRDELPHLVDAYKYVSNSEGFYSFSGREGVIRVYEEILKESDMEVLNIADSGELKNLLADYMKEFLPRRLKRKISYKCVAPSTNDYCDPDPTMLRQARFIKAHHFPFNMDIHITNTKVIMGTLREGALVGFIIMHPEVVENYKVLFNFLWQMGLDERPNN